MVEREDNLRVKECAISAVTDVVLPFYSFYAGGNISFLFDLSDFSQQACDKRPGNTGEEKHTYTSQFTPITSVSATGNI